ncbi:MAG: cysteine hydrolase family protein [Candidatus Binatia bacterium]
MALTIDKGRTALLAMDFQNDIVDEEGAFKDFGFAQMVKQTEVLGKTGRLLEAARRAGLKVIYVVVQFRPGHPEVPRTGQLFQALVEHNALVEDTWGATIHPAVAPQAGEAVVTKRGVSAFAASDLSALLRTAGINTLLLTGVATNFVVEGTAREAADRGYNVMIVQDCCASMSLEAHEVVLKTALPFLVTIITSEEVMAALQ